MGCVASKLENDDEVVLLCRERKRLLKSAVERRYALADAHCKYFHSMYSVAAALTLFVARHSAPSSPFLITFPPPCSDNDSSLPTEKLISNPMFLQQKPSEPTQETIHFQQSDSSDSSEEGDDGVVLQQQHHHQHHYQQHQQQHQQVQAEQVCGYFYTGMPPPMPSPKRDYGWDFFNPFEGVRPEVSNPFVGGFSRASDEDLRVVREQEGIPDLEEEGVERKVMVLEDDSEDDDENVDEENGIEVMKVVGGTNVSRGGDQKGLTVIDTPVRGRELLEALRDVADHFIRAYDNGKDVSKMLEVNRVHLQTGLEEIKENSSKLVQAITWNKSSSSASSTKSFLASSSKSSSSWTTEFKNELFDDDYGGMEAGSHSQTLGRLYAWEKKLYEEVKAGDSTRKLYDRKCAQLRNQDVKGDDTRSMDKTRAVVKDLYTRMWVAIRTAESISERIEKLRDEELQPQLIELLQGLMKTWKVVLESHETQNKIMYEVKSFTCPTYGKFCNDSHRIATHQLDNELQNWRSCFIGYFTAQKAYIEALNGWLSKFVVPEVELYSKGRSSTPPYQIGGPPLLVIARDWLNSLQKLPDRSVTFAIKSFAKDVRALVSQQGEEQQQKRKVDGLAKELDRRITAFQRAENRILESKLSEQKLELDVENRFEYLTERKDLLDMFRKRLDTEKEKHHNYMQETQRITLNGFQTGLTSVFESLTEFSKASLKMYNELVAFSEKAKVGDDKAEVPSYIQDSHVGVNVPSYIQDSHVGVDGG
ncbi:hypothetical protein MKW94_010828 [Papaver nudicaule]|uniref:Nitrate regulatory gene2 protein n=1 Tax=Papaver nudicaule TaxID=74823 RepID=A0AA41VXI1_PAPNU|nr:hypothetical protein [Papaver nudicaule]